MLNGTACILSFDFEAVLQAGSCQCFFLVKRHWGLVVEWNRYCRFPQWDGLGLLSVTDPRASDPTAVFFAARFRGGYLEGFTVGRIQVSHFSFRKLKDFKRSIGPRLHGDCGSTFSTQWSMMVFLDWKTGQNQQSLRWNWSSTSNSGNKEFPLWHSKFAFQKNRWGPAGISLGSASWKPADAEHHYPSCCS